MVIRTKKSINWIINYILLITEGETMQGGVLWAVWYAEETIGEKIDDNQERKNIHNHSWIIKRINSINSKSKAVDLAVLD